MPWVNPQASTNLIDISGEISKEVLRALVEFSVWARKKKIKSVGVTSWWRFLLEKTKNLSPLVSSEDWKMVEEIQKTEDLPLLPEESEKIYFQPEIKESIILALVKKKPGIAIGDLEVLAMCFSMPKINGITKKNLNLAKVYEIVKQLTTNSLIWFEEIPGISSLVQEEEEYWKNFSSYSDQVEKIVNQKQSGLIIHGNLGADLMAIVGSGVVKAKEENTEFKYLRIIKLDAGKISTSLINSKDILSQIDWSIKINSPVVIVLNNIEGVSETALDIIDLLNNLAKKNDSALVVMCNEVVYRNKLAGEKIPGFIDYFAPELDEVTARKLISEKLEKIRLESKIGIENGMMEQVFAGCKKYFEGSAFPGKSNRLIDEMLSEARILGSKALNSEVLRRSVLKLTGDNGLRINNFKTTTENAVTKSM